MTLRIGSTTVHPSRETPLAQHLRSIVRMEADILLIAGFRTGLEGMELRARLDRLGLIYQTPSDTDPDEAALVLASRCPFVQIDLPAALAHCHPTCLHLAIADFHLIACDLGGRRPGPDLRAHLLDQARRLRRDRGIFFIGRGHPPGTAASGQHPARPGKLAPALAELGYLDAYQLPPSPTGQAVARPDARPEAAFGAFVTPALAPRLSGCFAETRGADGGVERNAAAVLRVG